MSSETTLTGNQSYLFNEPDWKYKSILLAIPILLAYFVYSKKKTLPLPPGPKGWPIVGNLFSLPQNYHWNAYDKLCTQLGTDILYLNMAGRPVIVLDTYEAAIELLENRSAQYSGRPRMTMLNELMGWDFNFVFMDYGILIPILDVVWSTYSSLMHTGESWRRQRKLFHHSFQPSAVHQFNTQQLRSARKFAINLKTTQNVMVDVRQMAGEVIMSITYGIDVLPQNDPYIEAAEISMKALLQTLIPGAFLVDFIPIMKHIPQWVPGATFQRKAKEWRQRVDYMRNLPFDAFLKAMEGGTSRFSFSLNSMQLAQSEVGGVYTEDNIKSVAAVMYQAGSDTIIAAISFCLLSVLKNPDEAKIAQEEIDSLTDSNRLPNFDDQPHTPYLDAFIKESLRYWSFGPLGIPHVTNTEDEYEGFRIPAGSLIFANIWKMHHNPEIFPDPFAFKPERFLGVNQTRDSHFDAIWGFGRRLCPGRHMAYNSIWISIATVLSVYDMKKAIGQDGKPIEPSDEITTTALFLPKPFQCSFTVRPGASALLSELAASDGEV